VNGYNPDCTVFRTEAYRTTNSGVTWQRVASFVRSPQARNLNVYPPGHPSTGLAGTKPALSIVHNTSEGDVLLIVDTLAGSAAGSMSDVVVQYRLSNADTCQGSVLDGCARGQLFRSSIPLDDFKIPQYDPAQGRVVPTSLLSRRPGGFVQQPAIFAGAIDRDDPRVGIYWYSQPWGDQSINAPPGVTREEFVTWTTVEGLFSTDWGQTYGALRNVAVPSAIPSVYAQGQGVGLVFAPCAFISPQGRVAFGDYNGGAFLSSSPGAPGRWDLRAVAGWADSREGCNMDPIFAVHQHVFAGVFR